MTRIICKFQGHPTSFLPNALKRCFRLSRVLLKLCRLILGCAINFYLFGHSRGTVAFPNLLGLFCPFPENLGSYCPSEILADLFLCTKRKFLSLRKQKVLIKKAREDISLTENLRRLQVFRTDIQPETIRWVPLKFAT